MRKQIYILFNFVEGIDLEDVTSKGRYRILVSYDRDGDVSLLEDADQRDFETKESMIEFIQNTLDESEYEQVFLLAANDFNIGLESCHSAEEFQDLFVTHGSLIQGQSHQNKKSLFGKLF